MKGLGRLASMLVLACLGQSAANAGSYLLISTKIREADPNVDGNVGPYAIVHPPGWAGESGTLTVRLCIRPGSEAFIPSLDWAIMTWNCRLSNHPNCPDCRTWEDVTPPPPGGPFPMVGTTYSLASVLLHEVGHCIGLDHPNLHEWITTISSEPWRTGTCDADSNGSCGDATSFTEVGMATEVLVGTDDIRGSRDDSPLNQCGFIAPPMAPWMVAPIPDPDAAANAACLAKAAQDPLGLSVKAACSNGMNVQCCPPCPGPACPTAPMAMQHLAWFRQSDNNPFASDGVVIDRSTFTRNPNLLPAGSSYAANGNRRVGAVLGYSGSQAVMYSALATGEGWNGLSADDVNMIKMGMTGVDRFANSPAPPDDYVLVLERVADCAQADIEVYDNPVVGSDFLGGCVADIEPTQSVPPVFGLVLHHTVKSAFPKPTIDINTLLPIDYRLPLAYIDFESGDLTKWSGGSAP